MQRAIIGTLITAVILLTTPAGADCVGTVQSVTQDQKLGKILVATQYTIAGNFVQDGQTRYDETSGTALEIAQKIQADIKDHCSALIARIPANADFIQTSVVGIQKQLTAPVITQLQNAVGKSVTVKQTNIVYKGKEINVQDDGTNSVTDAPIVPSP